MQSTSLFLEGINLLTLGMGFVFIFLIFLVYATRAMSQLIVRFARRKCQPKPPIKKPLPTRPKPTQIKTKVNCSRCSRPLSITIKHNKNYLK